MVNKVNKLPLKDVLAAIDMNAKNVWDELSDDERKQVSFYLLNRYVSAVKGSKQDKEQQILKRAAKSIITKIFFFIINLGAEVANYR